ncbi:hypothetical protein ACS0TY_015843 [Phlomoides rotata]
MAEAVPQLRWSHLNSASPSIQRLSPPHLHHSHRCYPNHAATFIPKISCKAVQIETPAPIAAKNKNKKNRYEIDYLTTWLLKQEQAGIIDAELTIVLSSISLACKQIASLLQRSSIVNLTGAHGTINIQGEDQKKLDVISNELKKYLDDLRKLGPNGKPYSGRYVGCLVGEIHRMLLIGGIYGNPDNKNSKNGNLRLLYECAPMSYLVEQAGGKAIDGSQRILDIKPEQIHQRTPIFIGSPDEIEKLETYLTKK